MNELHRTRGEAIEGKPRPIPPLGGPEAGEGAADLTPADALSLEHDVIRRVLRVIQRHLGRIEEERSIDPVFLATAVDFIHTYAVRVHHGKEEEILFRQLDDKTLSAEHRRMMEELAREHVEMRRIAEALVESQQSYGEAEEVALGAIKDRLEELIDLYPGHMETEDESFFPAAMGYLDDAEQQTVMELMKGHDRAMVHERYGSVADDLEARTEEWALRE